jgi:hypothetical protein
MTSEQFAEYRRQRLQLVAEARAFYDGVATEIFGSETEARNKKLLATAIYFNLDSELAKLLADETEERKQA